MWLVIDVPTSFGRTPRGGAAGQRRFSTIADADADLPELGIVTLAL